jgi:hypothetical protein
MQKETKWTEKKWKLCIEPQWMLWFLGEAATARKVRLFICACCRRAWHLVKDKRLKALLPLLEDLADGKLTDREREQAREVADSVRYPKPTNAQQCLGIEFRDAMGKKYYVGAGFGEYSAGLFGEFAACAFGYAAKDSAFGKAKKAERKMQATLVREIFGNPFRRVKFNPAWRTTDVKLLAQGIYEEHAFDRMPILADALQDAGCASEDILNHLRDPQAAHVRGCWALDLVLGKE